MSVFVTKALQQVWCSPEMDYQRIYSMGRLTRSGGILRNIAILFDYVDMPTLDERYHVFQLGNRTTSGMGITSTIGKEWVSLLDIINADRLELDVYTDIGTILPAKDVFMCRIDDTNLVVAIRDNGNLFGERTEGVFLRSYRNAWFSTVDARDLTDTVHMVSVEVKTIGDAADLINQYLYYSRLRGIVRVTIDGIIGELTSVANVPIGSHVDMLYDASVHWTTTLPVSDLKMYHSNLDEVEKYIIHPAKGLTGASSILYHDDVDFFVVTGNGVNRRGLFLHSNVASAQRMITHNDFALRVGHVNALCLELGAAPEDCAVQMVIRKSGIERTLSYERHFIHELYKLPDNDIIEILAEERATIQYWTAACLECSYYTKIMRSGLTQVTEDDALKAFGYGGCTVETMQSPIRLTDSATDSRPVGYRGEVVIIANSRSTGESSIQYLTPSSIIDGQQWPNGVVDFRLASVAHRRKVYHNIEVIDLPSHLSFTAYRAVKEGGVRTGEWFPATEGADYAYEAGRFKWLIDLPLYDVVVVPGDYSDLISVTVDYPAETLIDLTMTHSVDGQYIPTAEIHVVAGKKLLTPDVDFIVHDGKLHITNLEIGRRTAVPVKIARLGCQSDTPRIERGFVMDGLLSHNNHYDLHGSSVKSVTCGDTLIAHDEQVFAESGGSSSILVDGQPYRMAYYRGPIQGVDWWKVEDLRADWDETFGALEDYLTGIMEEQDIDDVVTITRPLLTFSPFMHTIVNDLSNGSLNFGTGRLTDELIVQLVERYVHLLDYDPVNSVMYDNRFIDVLPIANANMVDLTEDQLYLLHRLNDLYLGGVLNFNAYIGVYNG